MSDDELASGKVDSEWPMKRALRSVWARYRAWLAARRHRQVEHAQQLAIMVDDRCRVLERENGALRRRLDLYRSVCTPPKVGSAVWQSLEPWQQKELLHKFEPVVIETEGEASDA